MNKMVTGLVGGMKTKVPPRGEICVYTKENLEDSGHCAEVRQNAGSPLCQLLKKIGT